MRLTQTLKSASFKLTAAYSGLFALSVGILAAVTYLSVTTELSREFHGRILAEINALEADFKRGGTKQLLRTISDRQRGRLANGLDYTLSDANGKHLFGTLPNIRCVTGWTTLTGPPDGDEAPGEMERLAVYARPLPQGLCLLVGDDWGLVEGFGSVILKNFAWVSLLSLTMAVGGGLFLSSRFLKRIDVITKTAEAIIEGDINRRVPRRGAPDDLDKLAATLNRMLDRTCALMDNLKHLSNDIAHDLRTPLGRLRRLLESSSTTGLTAPEYQQLLERSLTEVDSILDLFGAILRISQIESGSRRGGFQRVSLSQLVTDVSETFSPSLEEDGKSLEQNIESDCSVLGDPELLTLSLANLLENTIVHTPFGSKVSVSVHHRGGGVELSVADNGPGVPEADCERIFQRFYRQESSRTTAGNGLGLSIVGAVAELHAAKLSASNNQPGLKIELVFPQAS